MVKVGTHGWLRSVKSVLDYLWYFEFKLSPRPKTLACAVLAIGAVSILVPVFGPRVWSGPNWVAVLPMVGLVARVLWQVSRADNPARPHFRRNARVHANHENARPTEREEALGFVRVFRKSGFDGPIVVADEFNRSRMSDPAVDWTLKIDVESERYDALLTQVRSMRTYVVPYGRQKILRALKDGKALINEPKIAFAETFPPPADATDIRIFKTDYFTGLCTAERVSDNVVVLDGENRQVVSQAETRSPFIRAGSFLRLPDVAQATPPVSLHFGVEVMALSSDNILRVPVQSGMTQYSQNMRAPLGSGSIDWEDLEGATTLKGLIRHAGQRELAEEWGHASSRVATTLLISRLEPIGYFRNLARCGKPQFVCAGRFDLPDADLRADKTEVTRDAAAGHQVSSLKDLERVLDQILRHTGDETDSVALLGAVHILLDFVKETPERAADLLELPEG